MIRAARARSDSGPDVRASRHDENAAGRTLWLFQAGELLFGE